MLVDIRCNDTLPREVSIIADLESRPVCLDSQVSTTAARHCPESTLAGSCTSHSQPHQRIPATNIPASFCDQLAVNMALFFRLHFVAILHMHCLLTLGCQGEPVNSYNRRSVGGCLRLPISTRNMERQAMTSRVSQWGKAGKTPQECRCFRRKVHAVGQVN